MPGRSALKLHLPDRWTFTFGPEGSRAWNGPFQLWVTRFRIGGLTTWSCGLADSGGPLVRVSRAASRQQAIAAVEAAAVAGGWMLPREGGRRGKSNS